MTKFKRDLVPGTYLTAADMLLVLSQQQLKAAAVNGRITLAVQPPVAWLLDSCCVGRHLAECSALPAGNSPIEALAAAVITTAGVNTAEPPLWGYYQEYQQQCMARQQRRTGKAAATAATAGLIAMAAAALSASSCQANSPAAAPLSSPPLSAAAATAATAATQGDDGVDGTSSKQQQQRDGLQGTEGEQQGKPVDETLRLVQLSFQEAVFLSHVLNCCHVHPEAAAAADHSSSYASKPRSQTDLLGIMQQVHLSSSSAATSLQQEQERQQGQVRQQPPVQQQPQVQQLQWLTATQLWQWCCALTPGGASVFAPQYAAYHHLRSLGWLPLAGLAYGADYVLYQLHPEYAHSDFVVTVMVEAKTRQAAAAARMAAPTMRNTCNQATAADVESSGLHNQEDQGVDLEQESRQLTASAEVPSTQQQSQVRSSSSTQLAWLDACIMHRLARQVLKQMLLIYIIVPEGLQLQHPSCVQQMQVREVLVKRWVPGGREK